jgi:PilZ domain
MVDQMGHPLNCPQCKKASVLRVRPQSPREHVAALVFVSPFQCSSCRHRFLASRLGLDYSAHSIDRREHLRIPVRLYLSFSGGKVRGEGTVLDLSMGGCIIKSETQVHTDDIFYLQLSLDDSEPPLEVAAMVRSVSARGIAFKFLRAAQENKRLLAFVQAQASDHSVKSSLHAGVAA